MYLVIIAPVMKADKTAYVHPNAAIHGNVGIGAGSSIWPGAAIRGDYNSITVGQYSNIQDNAVVHCSPFKLTRVGDWVTVGHSAIIHGAIVGDNVLVGIRSVLLDGVEVGSGSLIAAGVIVPEGLQIPPDSFVSGSPAKVRPSRPGTKESNRTYALSYHILSRQYMDGKYSIQFDELMRQIVEWTKRLRGG